LWITENGYATNLGHDPGRQGSELRDTVEKVHAYSGTLGVTDYRYFNLRDNDSQGTGMFDTDGVLRDDYSPKPSFAALRDRIVADGVVQAAAPSPPRTVRRAHRRARARARHRVRRRARARRPRFTG
jgi:hypothetical protein